MKYQRFTPSGCKDMGLIKFEFEAKTQFLCCSNSNKNITIKLICNLKGVANKFLRLTKSTKQIPYLFSKKSYYFLNKT